MARRVRPRAPRATATGRGCLEGTPRDRACPALLGIFGAGSDTAGALLLAAGDNPERLRSEAAFAKLTGVSPVQASSGNTTRHRLNRGGDRHANAALHRIVLVQLRWRHPPTIDYVARRTAEGRSKREIIWCLKRYVAREVYRALTDVLTTLHSPRDLGASVCKASRAA